MRLLLLLLLALAASCKRAEPLAVAKSLPEYSEFKTFGYDYSTYYFDLRPKSIIPDKPYQYWAYVGYNHRFEPQSEKFVILKEGGDTLLRRGIDSVPASKGFFWRGLYDMRSDFIVIIENDSLRYISTISKLRDFLGTIDNVNEAVLLAETFHYVPDYESGGNDYRMVNGAFELQLIAVDPVPTCVGGMEYDIEKKVTVTKEGFIKAVSRGKNKTVAKAE